MSKVLIVNPFFYPGYKSGGPQQTIKNICDVFGKTNEIFLVTQNYDFGDTKTYSLETGKWLDKYNIHIMYIEKNKYGLRLFRNLYKEFDVIMACGLFCRSTIQMILINYIGSNKKLYVLPMGVFCKSALEYKSIKKRLFLRVFSSIGLFKRIIWSFTSVEELEDATASIGSNNITNYIIAEDLPRYVDFNIVKNNLLPKTDLLRVVFLSRIVPKKNLLYAIEILNGTFDGIIQFDIYGIIEDAEYWGECEFAIDRLPHNIMCKYNGTFRPDDSIRIFRNYDVFLFPTQGENYGHVIYESLASGCVPLISNTTPWKDFGDKNCGKVVKLDDTECFRDCLLSFLKMSPDEFMRMKMNAVHYAEKKYLDGVEDSGYKAIFGD